MVDDTHSGLATGRGRHKARPSGAVPASTRGKAASLRDTAYREIKRRIITCELKPGEALSEAAVSEALRIGRTPVHQALDRLMVDGLVEVIPRKGVIVRPLSIDELYDIIDVRTVLECRCVVLAAQHAEATDCEELEDILARTEEAVSDRAVEDLMQLDRSFHSVLARASRNAVLTELLGNLHDRSLRFWFVSLRTPDHHRRVLDQHRAIVDAVRAGDAKRAEAAMRAHIEDFQANVTRQL